MNIIQFELFTPILSDDSISTCVQDRVINFDLIINPRNVGKFALIKIYRAPTGSELKRQILH